MEEFRLEIEEDGEDPTSISVKHPMRYKWGLPQNLRLQHCCSDSHRLIPPLGSMAAMDDELFLGDEELFSESEGGMSDNESESSDVEYLAFHFFLGH